MKTDLSTISAFLKGNRPAMLAAAVEALEVAIDAGAVPNKLFTDAKSSINWAVDQAVTAYVDEAHRAFWAKNPDTTAPAVFDTLIMGAYNLPAGLKEATKKKDAAGVAFLSALLPLHELLKAAKPLIVKRAVGQPTAKQIEVQKAREAEGMHCQCCGRLILANTGKIAHHGYQRPTQGWQTASCYGAQELPFEVSRDTLGQWIAALGDMLGRLREARVNVNKEAAPIVFSFTDYSKPISAATGRRPSKTIDVTRATFDALAAKHGDEFRRAGIRTFDDLKKRDLASRDGEIRATQEELKIQRARFDGWKQTHRWEAGEWAAL